MVSANLVRRHLNEGQRAMIAARLATLSKGDVVSRRIEAADKSDGAQIWAPQTVEEASEMFNVSRGTVANAKTVLKALSQFEI